MTYTERTYRNWTNKLIDRGVLRKDKSNTSLWRTISFDGEKFQEEVEENDEDYLSYIQKRGELFKEYADLPSKERWKKVFDGLWSEFHCVYYRCGSFDGKAWADNEIIRELLEIITGYYET